jgi:hypothetical protein
VTEPVDVVLNLAPAPDPAALLDLLRPGGVLVTTVPPAPDPGDRDVRTAALFVRSDRDQLARLVGMVDAGRLSVPVAETVPFPELAAVHARSEGRHPARQGRPHAPGRRRRVTTGQALRAPSALVPLWAAGVLSFVVALAVVFRLRSPGPDADIGLGLLLLAGLATVGLLLLWVLVRVVVLLRRGRRPVAPA